MSAPDKPDPARGWLFVEKLLAEDERARLDEASDEEVERRMRELEGEAAARSDVTGSARVPSVEEILARAAARTAKGPAKPAVDAGAPDAARPAAGPPGGAAVKAVRPATRTKRPVVWLIAAAVGVLAVAVWWTQRDDGMVSSPAPGPVDTGVRDHDAGDGGR
jgi:hypothetical protein